MACSKKSLEATDKSIDCCFEVLNISFIIFKDIRHQSLNYLWITLSENSGNIKELWQIEDEVLVNQLCIEV
jgi:hypothetical protein